MSYRLKGEPYRATFAAPDLVAAMDWVDRWCEALKYTSEVDFCRVLSHAERKRKEKVWGTIPE